MGLNLGRRGGRRGLAVAAIGGGILIGLMAPLTAKAGYASIVIDEQSGAVLSEVNADQVNHPASLTKMMTLYLAFDALKKGKLRWEQPLHVSSWASEKQPTKLGLEPGDTVTVRDCVLGMIVLSANDAATVMGEALGGSEDHFAQIMTERARALGMASTNFVNDSGLPDDDQVTTARDLSKLAIALYTDFPDEYHYFSTREFEFRGRLIVGHNHLMYRYPGMDGLKTGFTQASGFNLASSAERDGRRLVGVVMGSQSAGARDRLMETLLDNGFGGRDTDPLLVAEAAGQRPRVGHRLLVGAERVIASLSPVQKAEAAPLVHNPAPSSSQAHMVWTHASASGHTTPAVVRGDVQAAASWSDEDSGAGRKSSHGTHSVAHAKAEHGHHAKSDDAEPVKPAHASCEKSHVAAKHCKSAPASSAGHVQLASAHR